MKELAIDEQYYLTSVDDAKDDLRFMQDLGRDNTEEWVAELNKLTNLVHTFENMVREAFTPINGRKPYHDDERAWFDKLTDAQQDITAQFIDMY